MNKSVNNHVKNVKKAFNDATVGHGPQALAYKRQEQTSDDERQKGGQC